MIARALGDMGLLRYGFRVEARELALKTFDMALDRNKATREFYDADTGKRNGMNPFWGGPLWHM